jgi:hypothetical protein
LTLIELVGKKLSELGYEVQWQLRPKTDTSLTYTFIGEDDTVFTTDGKETEYTLQVDVWKKDDYTELVEKVIIKMQEIGFYKIFIAPDDYEEDTNYYHKAIRFNYLESEG